MGLTFSSLKRYDVRAVQRPEWWILLSCIRYASQRRKEAIMDFDMDRTLRMKSLSIATGRLGSVHMAHRAKAMELHSTVMSTPTKGMSSMDD
jgi:hypothetical protein